MDIQQGNKETKKLEQNGYNQCKQDFSAILQKKIDNLKASRDYPHNFKGQMVEDFEWCQNELMKLKIDKGSV